ncbi:MBOAT family O-acyltransferase [Geomonas anaerohicana]|uniref:MBOAT family protein n=1 Tax=Geomonas anaerohicana TaxID=2798583 RepID=A0ABS0YIG4_9BACT|nr:MBOAT family O-acyltransferase [Geomonas anaerohicana]MBJ6751919.1 MBOAT family protein [Geomonas anaerohicana]
MPFNSLDYFLFLPAVYLVFYLVGDRARWGVLLAASFGFYAALKVPYLPAVLALVAVTTYCFGIWLHRAQAPGTKRMLLWGGIAANVLVLVAMKYLPFLSENLRAVTQFFSLELQVPAVRALVAIGVSYYVFQAISYLIDIYFEIEEPEPHFGYFALYLSFFPKLLQGPIERTGDLLPQLKTPYRFDYDNMRYGMLLFAWGLFKKMVLADRLGIYADAVYNDIHAANGMQLLLGTYAYAFQIFMDFSGYTDMALGTARLFNINLTQNFNSPYLATSVADFWRRWHISFSRWILDYIFKPLQMQWRDWRTWGTALALVAAFLVSGIWHGASWGFVIWGGLHGLYMACSVFYKPYQKKLYQKLGIQKSPYLKYWQMLVTFHLVCFAWVFFRVNSLSDALYICRFPFVSADNGLHKVLVHGFHAQKAGVVLVAGVVVAAYGVLARNEQALIIWNRYCALRWLCYNALLLALILLGGESQGHFIYFNF